MIEKQNKELLAASALQTGNIAKTARRLNVKMEEIAEAVAKNLDTDVLDEVAKAAPAYQVAEEARNAEREARKAAEERAQTAEERAAKLAAELAALKAKFGVS